MNGYSFKTTQHIFFGLQEHEQQQVEVFSRVPQQIYTNPGKTEAGNFTQNTSVVVIVIHMHLSAFCNITAEI